MVDDPISLTDYKLKVEEEIKDRHDKRLNETVARINQMAEQGKILVVCESKDGKQKHVENLDQVLKNYTEWGFSPAHKEKKGYFRSFYLPDEANIPMFQDLYTINVRPTEDEKESPDET